jgi:hypothetical protein
VCLWLEGEFADAERPDLAGLAFDLPSQIQEHPDYQGILAVCAREVRAGSREEPQAATLLARLAGSMVVRLTPFGGGRTELMGPRSLIERLAARAAARREAGG